MRWLVELSTIGKPEVRTLCIEAESWQRALQSVRTMNGDTSQSLSGFAVDILEDGFRAVDALASAKYIIRPTNEERPLSRTLEDATITIVPPSRRSAPPSSRNASEPIVHHLPDDLTSSLKSQRPAPDDIALIFSRQEEVSSTRPLTYRELVYSAPINIGEDRAEELLRAQFELLRAELATANPGKLVNLAVFDNYVDGAPPGLPLVTLTWKDWKGQQPVIAFPRRRPPLESSRAKEKAPQESDKSAPPTQIASKPPVSPQLPLSQPTPSQTAPSARRSRTPTDDLISELFDAMHDLHFLKDAMEGGDFCIALALEKIPSQGGLVHLYDIDKREFVAVSARGGSGLLLRRESEADPLLCIAMKRRQAIIVSASDPTPPPQLARFEPFGGVKSAIVAPVMKAGRFLGAIEIANPLDGTPFTEVDGNALTYIAEQFAEFVEARGIVIDPDKISRNSTPPSTLS